MINKKEALFERILSFGVKIIKLVNRLPKTPAGFKLGSQLVASATSIGANTQEAQDASSKADFINKMSIALREAKETKFWLTLIKRAELLPSKLVDSELKESDELCAIYSTIVKRTKLKLSNVKSQMSNVVGFTLIEILIAISIVAVLSALGFSAYLGIQSKARDSIRKNDLTRLATALELYAQQHNLAYMDGTPGTEGNCSTDTSTFYDPVNGIAPYMNDENVPKDPQTSSNYCYISVGNGQSFRLFAKLETNSEANISCVPANYNFSITSDNIALSCPP